MVRRIRFIYLSSIIPLVFVLRLYQIYMNIGINPFVVDFLREKYFLRIVLALTIYPIMDLAMRTFSVLKEGHSGEWDKCFLLIASMIADAQAIVLLNKGIISQVNVQYFFAYQMIGLCAYYLGKYQKDELRVCLYTLSILIAVTAVYGLVEWSVYSSSQRQILLSTEWDRLVSFYGNAILAGSSLLVGYWLISIIRNTFVKATIKAIIVIAIFATMSRSCWLGLLFSIAFLLISRGKKLKNKKFILIITVCVCVGIAGSLVRIPYIRDLALGRFMNITESDSYRLRIEYWKFGIENFFSDAGILSKLIGTGYTTSERLITSSDVYMKWKDVFPYDIHFDNVYISILTEFGLIGMVSVIILVRRVFFVLFRGNGKEDWLCCGLAIVGLIPAVLLWDPIYCPINMILFIAVSGVIMADDNILTKNRGNRSPHPRMKKIKSWFESIKCNSEQYNGLSRLKLSIISSGLILCSAAKRRPFLSARRLRVERQEDHWC